MAARRSASGRVATRGSPSKNVSVSVVLDRDGSLTPEAVEVLNNAAIDDPHEMYPLSQVAADLGRAGLVRISHGEKIGRNIVWIVELTEAGWPCVTDPEQASRYRKRTALKRLTDRKMIPSV
jgi:hypothetical protein